LKGKGGRNLAREIIVLEVEVAERRKGGNVRRKITIEKVRSKAENPEGIKLTKGAWWDVSHKPYPREPEGNYGCHLVSK